MISKHFLISLAVLSLLVVGLVMTGAVQTPAAQAQKPLKICVSLDKMQAFREGEQKAWEAAAKELGVEILVQVAGEDAQRQSSQIDTCIAQKVDGIVSIPWDNEAVLQDIERAHAAGIPFVTVDQAPADLKTVDFHIGGDPMADGLAAGKRLVQLVGDKACKVVDLQGALSADNGIRRDKGFKEGISSKPNITIVSEVPTEWRPEPALAGMENALQAHPDICAVYAATDGLLPPIFSSLQKAGRYQKIGEPGHVIIESIDGDPQGYKSVKEGYMDAGYATDIFSMTKESLQAIMKIKSGQKIPENERIKFLPGIEYMPSNLDKVGSTIWGAVFTGAAPAAGTPAAAAEKPGKGLKMCLSLDKMQAFREGQQKFWRLAADELGVQMIEHVAGEDAQRQSSQIDTCISQKVDFIVAIPWDYEAVLQDIERAHAAKIPFITVDQAPAVTDTVDYHTGADPFADGLHGGQRLVSLVGDKACKVVDLQGALSHFNGQMRDAGFKAGIKDHANITIVSEVPTEWRPEPVLSGMENALQAHPDLCAVWAASDGFLPPVWSALQKAGRYAKVGEPGHVIVLSVDGDPQGCQSVKDGYMDAGYAQPVPKMSRDSVLVGLDMVKNGKKFTDPNRMVFIPGVEYMLSNIKDTASQVWGCLK